MAYLRIEENRGSTELRELNDSVVIGRSPECGLYFPDRLLSRRHLRLEESEDGWLAIDLDSTNGSWLRGERITTHLLREGDALQVGNLTLWFSSRRPVLASRPKIGPEPTSAEKSGPLADLEIAEILNERDSDSVDEDWSEIEQALAHNSVTAAVAPIAASAPSQVAPHRKIDAPSLWEIAMKPGIVNGKGSTPESTGPVPARFSDRILLRFGSDSKVKKAATAVVIAALLAGGYFWLGNGGGARGRMTIASPGANAQAASHTKNGAFDLPV